MKQELRCDVRSAVNPVDTSSAVVVNPSELWRTVDDACIIPASQLDNRPSHGHGRHLLDRAAAAAAVARPRSFCLLYDPRKLIIYACLPVPAGRRHSTECVSCYEEDGRDIIVNYERPSTPGWRRDKQTGRKDRGGRVQLCVWTKARTRRAGRRQLWNVSRVLLGSRGSRDSGGA